VTDAGADKQRVGTARSNLSRAARNMVETALALDADTVKIKARNHKPKYWS
jgi:hypothetical protein